MATYVTVRTVTNRVVVRSPGGASGGGGGGGVSDHDGLGASSLVWTSSAHTGTASRLAGFSGSGAAAYYAIGTDVQAYDATLASLAALGTAADRYAYTTGIDTWAEGTITAAGRAILDDADAAAQLVTLGAEPAIAAGTTGQYWRGDKSWQTLDKTAVGLSNVENTALSTWAGSTNITTLGTIATGTWSATAIATAKIADATSTPGAAKIVVSDGSGKVDGWVSSASTSTPGLVTLATDGEESADAVQGTDTRLHALILTWLGW